MPKTIPMVTRPMRIIGLLRMLKTETIIAHHRVSTRIHLTEKKDWCIFKGYKKLTGRPLKKVKLAAQRPHLDAFAHTPIHDRQRLALIPPLITTVRLPGGKAPIGGNIDAQRLEAIGRAVDVCEVRVRRDVVKKEGVCGGERRAEVLVQR